ncbi:hypothetical protein HMPREF9134_01042 [Porphyromonas catoniae F0037]|uniref:Uncharacterized protein n=1 Tax=Porphyromonas catoniae F0037 TaxID=1127696 RepID=L1NCS6_9PORP|nr:hypothetical protein HMPREF9134_01042 [Porphyromonas catoniae F0037]
MNIKIAHSPSHTLSREIREKLLGYTQRQSKEANKTHSLFFI